MIPRQRWGYINSVVDPLLDTRLPQGGARIARGAGSADARARVGRREGEGDARRASGRVSPPPTETEQIPDSEDDEEEGGAGPAAGSSGGARAGAGAGGVTAVVMEPGSDPSRVREAEARWGARAVEHRWVTYSIVHLDKSLCGDV